MSNEIPQQPEIVVPQTSESVFEKYKRLKKELYKGGTEEMQEEAKKGLVENYESIGVPLAVVGYFKQLSVEEFKELHVIFFNKEDLSIGRILGFQQTAAEELVLKFKEYFNPRNINQKASLAIDLARTIRGND